MPTSKKLTGYFIVFEGGEGVGKSTQIRRLVSWFESRKITLLVTQEPGGSPLGREIRKLLLGSPKGSVAPLTELLLYEADRAQHVHETVRPALVQGKIVISDRYLDSSTVYQGVCRKLGVKRVQNLSALASGGLLPDLVVLLDLPESVGINRIRQKRGLDRIEQEDSTFHRQVRRGFLALAKQFPRRFAVINAEGSEEDVEKRIRNAVSKRLKGKKLWKGL
jgi:dTMP kinase